MPSPGEQRTFTIVPSSSTGNRRAERFYLDVTRGRRDPGKYNLHLRVRNTEGLLRLCVGGTAHRNRSQPPREDVAPYAGISVSPPHLHVYIAGYYLDWVMPPPSQFSRPDSLETTWIEFLTYCNIELPEGIQESF